MEDMGLVPKPSGDPLVPKPTVPEADGMQQNIPAEHLHDTEGSRTSDRDDDGASTKTSQDSAIPPPQNPLPAGTDTTLLNAEDKPKSVDLDRAGSATKKLKAKAADSTKWKQNKQKQLRMEGKAYVSKRKKDGEIVTKQPRSMGPTCTSGACKRASNRFCGQIPEEAREKVFNDFWQHMTWAQWKLYVAGHVDRDPVERSRALGVQSRRSVSLRYHLMVDGERKQVCKNMFLSTLGIGEWSVLNWAQVGPPKTRESDDITPDERQPGPQFNQHHCTPALTSNNTTLNVDVMQEYVNPTTNPPVPEGPVRKKSRVAKPLTWKQNRQKQLRMEGKPYISKRKKDGTTITKAPRTLGPPCTSIACKRASNRFCDDISEETRNELFTGFWQRMNWAQRKLYVAELVDCDPVERTRAPWTQSRRSVSMRYHLLVDGDRRQVCKRMFLSTLGIGEWSVLNWAQNATQHEKTEEKSKTQTQRKSRKASEHIVLKEFLESLPKVPSYSSGTSISKLYLEPVFSNMSEVYRHYYNHCLDNNTTPLSRQVFCAQFKKMDLGLCDPKHYQHCSLGVAGNLFNELWEEYCMERGTVGAEPEKAGGQ
ncbi:uncharacterized protein LOC115436402 isoform X2 [Sphaeramia orbicularis]|nr:uncharacterized protein LOC115436402 isoform X2 [Sphaeramia orbicularis]